MQAIEAAVRPGNVVVDLGSGPGFFALIACRAGARRVYAIDLAEIVAFGRHFATANSFADRIEFLQGDSRQMQLPERADVVVSDIRGALPFSGHSIGSLEDARQRFLVEGGTMIPQRDTLYAAIVESGKFYDEIRSPWQSSAKGLDLSPALSYVLNNIHSTHITQEQLVTEPQSWWVIEYMKSPSTRAAATLHFQTQRSATAHGVAVWFDTQLFGKIGFSCAPGGAETVYGHSFLPWLEPVVVSAGQEIQVELHANLVGGDYIWRWETKIYEEGKGVVRHFQQSTLQGTLFSPQWLQRRSMDFVPVLSEAGEAERWLLEAMDGSAPLQEIASAAAERFPRVFRRQEEAFRRASELAEKFSR
jgi:protein arginine N-methyltransferase 1